MNVNFPEIIQKYITALIILVTHDELPKVHRTK